MSLCQRCEHAPDQLGECKIAQYFQSQINDMHNPAYDQEKTRNALQGLVSVFASEHALCQSQEGKRLYQQAVELLSS